MILLNQRRRHLLLAWIAGCVWFGTAQAQVLSVGTHRPAPRGIILGSITVTAMPATINFNLVPSGVAPGSNPIAVTTSWSGLALVSTLNEYAFFGSSATALSSSAPITSIPSSCVSGQVPTGLPTTFTPFTQTSPFGTGSSLQLFTISSILSLGDASRTDNLSLSINLSSLPQLPAATYTGVLFIVAQAM
ncbi:hypothetical protein [Tunturiibacter lichenicola]|uniref:hypothetical protein n=1 Tax=Tunturiibacter lichenicola TaxID=2051959 RepID=UPI0021B48ACF|nr:hypothetical protein [Edaphobacter lichenicola]